MKRFILIIIFCSSCQNGQFQGFSDWFDAWKDYSVTYLASQSTDSYLTIQQRDDLLDLFEDLQGANTCRERQDLVEKNQTLKTFGRQYNFLRGYLFDILFNYDYETALLQINRSDEERVAFTVVNAWKTIASINEINRLIDQISKCYPKEYVD
ncbi:MAG: hypothetical protein OXC37_05310 [Bdellovibrionaceae bacterium]|nr:hypothetical protein [Pseudobdellovibrionaceae bacterium]